MQDDSRNQPPAAREMAGETQDNLFLRGDTILGACEAVGRDFGFNPNWLRVLFAAAFYWNPGIIIGAYLALGLVVALSRLLFPAGTIPHPVEPSVEPAVPPGAARAAPEAGSLPLAA